MSTQQNPGMRYFFFFFLRSIFFFWFTIGAASGCRKLVSLRLHQFRPSTIVPSFSSAASPMATKTHPTTRFRYYDTRTTNSPPNPRKGTIRRGHPALRPRATRFFLLVWRSKGESRPSHGQRPGIVADRRTPGVPLSKGCLGYRLPVLSVRSASLGENKSGATEEIPHANTPTAVKTKRPNGHGQQTRPTDTASRKDQPTTASRARTNVPFGASAGRTTQRPGWRSRFGLGTLKLLSYPISLFPCVVVAG